MFRIYENKTWPFSFDLIRNKISCHPINKFITITEYKIEWMYLHRFILGKWIRDGIWFNGPSISIFLFFLIWFLYCKSSLNLFKPVNLSIGNIWNILTVPEKNNSFQCSVITQMIPTLSVVLAFTLGQVSVYSVTSSAWS